MLIMLMYQSQSRYPNSRENYVYLEFLFNWQKCECNLVKVVLIFRSRVFENFRSIVHVVDLEEVKLFSCSAGGGSGPHMVTAHILNIHYLHAGP